MTEKNQNEKNAAARQVELLAGALEQARQNDGVWMNASGKVHPRFYPQGVTISPFNALILALHSDQNQYSTNAYTLFSEAKKRGESVKGQEKGVPFVWYNWSEYIRKDKPEEKISRDDFQKLSPELQKDYKPVRNREYRMLFNIDQTTLSMVSKEDYDYVVKEQGSKENRSNTGNEYLANKGIDFINSTKENLVAVRMDDTGIAHYDAKEDFIAMPTQTNYANMEDYVRDLVRQAVNATGHPQRLDREALIAQGGKVAPYDVQKQNALVVELATGVKLLDMGVPAKLSADNMKTIDYWQRELKENPCLIDSVEADVNNALNMIYKAERGERIELKTSVNDKRLAALHESVSAHYFIADEIKEIPNKDTKEMVIVRDRNNKTADVVLPAGASIEVDNEVPGMNKGRIEKALKNEGLETVRFFNPDGIHGYRPEDSTFKDKDVSVSRLNNWKLNDIANIDTSDAVNRSNSVLFDKILMLKDDSGKWAMFMKPKDQKSFAVYPKANDVNLFFNTIREGNDVKSEQVRLDMAQKYYNEAMEKPDTKVDLFKSQASKEDLARIERVNIFKTKAEENKPSRILCLPKIAGMEKIAPRVVSQEQWQRMWLADDIKDYKTNLAASLFADVLRKGRTDAVALGTDKTEQEAQSETKDEQKLAEFHEANDKHEQKEEDAHTEYHEEEDKQNSQQTKEKEEQAKEKKPEPSPILRQFLDLKAKHPDALLLFRTGDFYETYMDDASKAAKILGITLTRSSKVKDPDGKPLALAGFPYHALDSYLPKLIRAGQRVAICDQIEAPRQRAQQENEQKQDSPKEELSRGAHR